MRHLVHQLKEGSEERRKNPILWSLFVIDDLV